MDSMFISLEIIHKVGVVLCCRVYTRRKMLLASSVQDSQERNAISENPAVTAIMTRD
ncbi:hypothetical protein H8959_006940 [Pygathrix nigripes]